MRNRMARLNGDTGFADSFDPNANNIVFSIALQADGKILASGFFNGANSIGGQTRNRIARLDGISGLADSFDPNANNLVFSMALQPDGKVLAGGVFNGANSIGGQARNFFARLTNDTAALQNLSVTRTTVTWIRSGSSPQFARVSFESSTDNMNYVALGDGTAIGSNWALSGLNLPIAQNIYIRARGYNGSGINNGSKSITESVRNVFLTLPPEPTQVVSRKLHNGTPFDINLPLVGNSGIECRSGGANNDYQVVFTFPNAVSFSSARASFGIGSISSSTGGGTNSVTVNLTGVISGQRITLTLAGASDGTNTGDLDVPMGVLIGDTTGDGSVNASDVTQTKFRSGQAVDATNFRSDVVVNGSINASDVTSVKLRSGTALP